MDGMGNYVCFFKCLFIDMFDHFLVDHVWPPWVSASHCIGLCWTFVQEDMSKHKVSWWNMNNLPPENGFVSLPTVKNFMISELPFKLKCISGFQRLVDIRHPFVALAGSSAWNDLSSIKHPASFTFLFVFLKHLGGTRFQTHGRVLECLSSGSKKIQSERLDSFLSI